MARHGNNTSFGPRMPPTSASIEEKKEFIPSKYLHTPRERKSRDNLTFYGSPRSHATISTRARNASDRRDELSEELRGLNTSHVSGLERAFNENRHPSRDERSAIASKLELEPRIVKYWFQNKRHMTRKEVSKSARARAAAAVASSRPTLDRIASLTELPSPRPRSMLDASYHPDHTPHIWGHMVSSPPSSPPAPVPAPLKRTRSASPSVWKAHPNMRAFSRSQSEHSLLNLHKKRKCVTLEWACTNAANFSSASSDHERDLKVQYDDDDEGTMDSRTEVSVSDEHEAITPFDGRSLDSMSIHSVLRSSSPSYSLISGLSTESSLGRRDIPHEKEKTALGRPVGKWPSIRLDFSNVTRRTVRNVHAAGSDRTEVSPVLAKEPTSRPESESRKEDATSSNNTRAEIEAALALCGLFSSA